MTIYATTAWHTVRLYVLTRDQYRCQIQGPRCTTHATEADHIIELSAGGAPYDPENLRAACKPCNSSRGAAHGNRLREPRSQRWY
jgi:5-methylcytosine-specific restriction endonuclease McrA